MTTEVKVFKGAVYLNLVAVLSLITAIVYVSSEWKGMKDSLDQCKKITNRIDTQLQLQTAYCCDDQAKIKVLQSLGGRTR